MDSKPLFSVLIANYNNGRYLMEAVESVRDQNYANWEIVLVDDGSTDHSQELYQQLQQDSRIRVFYNGENKGCGYTKRRCVELASGDICGFLDPDDVLLPEALMTHMEAHAQRPDVSCVFSRYYNCDEQLNIVSNLRLLQIPDGFTYFTHKDYMPEHLASFKRACYEKTIGIAPELQAGVDQDLYFKLEEVAPIFVLDRFTYKYRMTGHQLSQGENYYKALYWNLIVRHATCVRRHLDPEAYSCRDLSAAMASMADDLNQTENELHRVQSSRAYRFGKFLLKPFSWLKNR